MPSIKLVNDKNQLFAFEKIASDWFVNNCKILVKESFTDEELREIKEISEENEISMERAKYFYGFEAGILEIDNNIHHWIYYTDVFFAAIFEIIVGLINDNDNLIQETDEFVFSSDSVSVNDQTTLEFEKYDDTEDFMNDLLHC